MIARPQRRRGWPGTAVRLTMLELRADISRIDPGRRALELLDQPWIGWREVLDDGKPKKTPFSDREVSTRDSSPTADTADTQHWFLPSRRPRTGGLSPESGRGRVPALYLTPGQQGGRLGLLLMNAAWSGRPLRPASLRSSMVIDCDQPAHAGPFRPSRPDSGTRGSARRGGVRAPRCTFTCSRSPITDPISCGATAARPGAPARSSRRAADRSRWLHIATADPSA